MRLISLLCFFVLPSLLFAKDSQNPIVHSTNIFEKVDKKSFVEATICTHNSNSGVCAAGSVLHVGEKWYSPDLNTYLTITQNGNLTVYQNGSPFWISDTKGLGVTKLFIEPTGILKLQNNFGQTVWMSSTYVFKTQYLFISNDGSVGLIGNANDASFINWYTNWNNRYTAGSILMKNKTWTSPNFSLNLENGNLFLTDINGKITWESHTTFNDATHLYFDKKGSLGLYAQGYHDHEEALWKAETIDTFPGQIQLLAKNGALHIISESGTSIWRTESGKKIELEFSEDFMSPNFFFYQDDLHIPLNSGTKTLSLPTATNFDFFFGAVSINMNGWTYNAYCMDKREETYMWFDILNPPQKIYVRMGKTNFPVCEPVY